MPERVITRAREILEELESGQGPCAVPAAVPKADDGQISLTDMGGGEVLDRLRMVDINTLTPIEAMNLIYELKQKL